MTKDKLIQIVEDLKAKQKIMRKVLKNETLLESRATIERQIKNINSVCDRLVFNWNMLPASQSFFDNTVAEAELHLN